MPKKKLSDMVFQRVSPPDEKDNLSATDLANVIVRRLGLKRKESRADHATLLLELLKFRKENIPVDIAKIAQLLGVSQSQSYEEIRKWRTLGLVEFVKLPAGEGFVKGYMLCAPTTNRLLDKVEANFKGFVRRTRRIAKDFDDLIGLEAARAEKKESNEANEQARKRASERAESDSTLKIEESKPENDKKE